MTTERDPSTKLFGQLRWNASLSSFQAVVGLAAGLVSVGGALLAIPGFFQTPPPPPSKGQIVAVIEDAKTAKAITDARVEIFTPRNDLVTTVTPNYFGKARQELEEGPYRVRVSHPKYAAEVKHVVVVKGATAQLHVSMRGGASAPLAEAERVVKESVGAIKRIFSE
jgi:hypothetical protein